MPIVAVDWSNDDENLAVYNGTKFLKKMPKAKKGLTLVTENIPIRQIKEFLLQDIPVWRCNTNVVAAERERLGIEKTHKGDVRIIFDLYQANPDLFRRVTVDPVLQQFKALSSCWGGVQRVRLNLGNQIYHTDDAVLEEITMLLEDVEAKLLRSLEHGLVQMPIYREWLQPIRGMGPALAANLIAYTGDIDRFATVGKINAYCGLHVVDGHAPRREKGKVANWHHRLKSVILGRIGDLFVKCRTPRYREVYDLVKKKEKERCETANHAHRRAVRVMMKLFVKDYFFEYKRLGRGEVILPKITPDTPISKTRKKYIYKQKVKERKRKEKEAAKRAAVNPTSNGHSPSIVGRVLDACKVCQNGATKTEKQGRKKSG